MAKSQQSFNKNEKEKKRLKKREDKRKKMEARKADIRENGSTGIEFAYTDAYGNLSSTPPDPEQQKLVINAEDIQVSVPKTLEGDKEAFDPIRKGTVSFFDSSKGFGFIIDSADQEKYFTHVSGIIDQISENDKVSFELEKGMKGMNAVKVTLVK
ncbi:MULTISPECIES: cold-shock protein [Tenacibaculum]|uniref:DNA-binding protein n=3 Tax=Tenacibaculum finnmarkense TaxID=2781243 RepID=A0A2I2M7D0_9FLAO|nr:MULTISPECIES: cold shock domain-containing protein [Tenacibaculum]ALU74870.1 DNA-binding protein [Tenacibaculum dicentrarchi]MBE7634362.1 cold shock domain-containing protein [Tenacibaculum finnmarkense genomovar ulcerans]MBE7646303.1 cold shock domain-containing protein [Tenacibaculum finnmarkense genomovar ulcerans]MBE7648579.1 cold shock domain-containing protein [Tenacibaculum finnmarkense genomovar ulcerans]MBE7688733.1 cold shock domain-containing protein [Tenacibaculum finnmarkense g